MGLIARCDRCNCKFSFIDAVTVIRYDEHNASAITNLNNTAESILHEYGVNKILCEKCTDEFTHFISGGAVDVAERKTD